MNGITQHDGDASMAWESFTAGDTSMDWNALIAGDTSMGWDSLAAGHTSMNDATPIAWNIPTSWDVANGPRITDLEPAGPPSTSGLAEAGEKLMASELAATAARKPKVASKQDWVTHRQLITTLYSTMELPTLMRYMEEEHAFKAT